jgi:hypothetical protein
VIAMTITYGPDQLDDAFALWDDVLRSYAASLDEQRDFLLTARPDELLDERVLLPPMFAPPASMPPMPAQFESWARALLRDTEGLALLAADALQRIPVPMNRPRRPTTGAIIGGQSTLDRSL